MPLRISPSTKSLPQHLIVTAVTLVGAALSLVIVKGSIATSFIALTAISLSLICLHSPEAALHLLVLAMLLSPELGERTIASRGGSGVTIRLDDLLLVLIGLSWLVRMSVHNQLGLFLKTTINQSIFIYLTVCVLATAWGVLAGNTKPLRGFFFILKYFEYYFVYFMLINHLRSKREVERLLLTLLVTCLIINIHGLLQIPGGHRITAPFEGESGEPNTLGGYLVLMTAVSVSLAVYVKRQWLSLLLWGLAGLNTVTILFTKSRGSYLAFLGMGLTLILLTRKKSLLVIVLLGLVIGPFILPTAVKERISYTFTPQRSEHITFGQVALDPSTSARLSSWQDGLEALAHRPILGYGVTGYRFVDSQFLLVLVETGLIGFMAFSGLLLAIIRAGWQSLRQTTNSPMAKSLATGLLAGTAGMIVHSLSANTFIIVRIMEPFWFLAGLAVMTPTLERVNE